jgi:hypothetical protein
MNIVKPLVVVKIMIGSKIRNKIINHNWSFKALMNMDDAIRVLIDDMDISVDEMVEYLGQEWRNKIYDAFQSKIIPEMKSYLIDILDDASVNLPQQVPNTALVEEIKEMEVIPEDEKIAKLKEEIRKSTKQV